MLLLGLLFGLRALPAFRTLPGPTHDRAGRGGVLRLVAGVFLGDFVGHVAVQIRIERRCRWGFPLVYFGLSLVMFGVAMLLF